jgi:N-acetylglucosaminyl-diphospho-decaprenol L-rhamnosyltransferase
MIDLDIVIVNWNTGPQLRDCLQSILPATPASVLCVRRCIVVDNASVDGSANSLDGLSLPLTLIKNPENKGFGYASNQGAAVGSSEYILFLNPDVRLFKDSLTKSFIFLENPQYKQVGILGIQLVDESGVVHRNSARLPTPGSLFHEMLGLDRFFPAHFPPRVMIDWDHQVNQPVDHVEGSFFLVRRSLFIQLNGFDERFFLYFEDADFSFRARQAGWKSYYLADVQAFHRGGGTTERIKSRRLFYWFRSRLQYVAKHFGQPVAWGILIASLTVEFQARIFFNIIHLNWQHLIETIKAYGFYLRSLPPFRRDMGNENNNGPIL